MVQHLKTVATQFGLKVNFNKTKISHDNIQVIAKDCIVENVDQYVCPQCEFVIIWIKIDRNEPYNATKLII